MNAAPILKARFIAAALAVLLVSAPATTQADSNWMEWTDSACSHSYRISHNDASCLSARWTNNWNWKKGGATCKTPVRGLIVSGWRSEVIDNLDITRTFGRTGVAA